MTTPSYLGYSDFSNSLHVSYVDYLQAREFSDANQTSISTQTKKLITATDRIGNSQLIAIKQVGDKIGDSIYQIRQSHDELKAEISAGLQRVSSVLEWGFSEVLFEIKKSNDLLAELLKVAKNTSKSWAYEKFDDARKQFSYKLYAEALVSVGHAIDGHGSNLGYKTEYRFHYLKGLITLGSFENPDPQIIDLKVSERAFLAAARYSAHDDPEECANAWLCAGRAAEVGGDLEIAAQHFNRGLDVVATAGLHYERARVRAAQNKAATAMADLECAIKLDMNLILKALRDVEFARLAKPVNELLVKLRRELVQIAGETAKTIRNELVHLRDVAFTSPFIDSKTVRAKDTCHEEVLILEEQLARLTKVMESGGIIDISNELRHSMETGQLLLDIDASFKQSIVQELKSKSSKLHSDDQLLRNASSNEHSRSKERRARIPMYVGVGMFMLQITLSLTECTSRGVTDKAAGLFLAAFIMSPIYAFVAGLVVVAVGFAADRNHKTSTEYQKASYLKASAVIQAEINNVDGRVFYSPVTNLETIVPDWARGR